MTEFRPGRFQILPPIIKNLLIINALVFMAQSFIPANVIDFNGLFALHTWQSPLFKPWQFITHMFMHANLFHIFSNMFALWMFGSILENVWGPKRFLTFYILCGLGAAFCHMVVLYFENQQLLHEFYSMSAAQQNYYLPAMEMRLNEPTLGASGAVFGCLAAFGYMFPNTYIYLYFFLPIKAKWFVIFYAAFELYATVQSSAGDNVAHVAHLGGALAGFIMVYFWKRSRSGNRY